MMLIAAMAISSMIGHLCTCQYYELYAMAAGDRIQVSELVAKSPPPNVVMMGGWSSHQAAQVDRHTSKSNLIAYRRTTTSRMSIKRSSECLVISHHRFTPVFLSDMHMSYGIWWPRGIAMSHMIKWIIHWWLLMKCLMWIEVSIRSISNCKLRFLKYIKISESKSDFIYKAIAKLICRTIKIC